MYADERKCLCKHVVWSGRKIHLIRYEVLCVVVR